MVIDAGNHIGRIAPWAGGTKHETGTMLGTGRYDLCFLTNLQSVVCGSLGLINGYSQHRLRMFHILLIITLSMAHIDKTVSRYNRHDVTS